MRWGSPCSAWWCSTMPPPIGWWARGTPMPPFKSPCHLSYSVSYYHAQNPFQRVTFHHDGVHLKTISGSYVYQSFPFPRHDMGMKPPLANSGLRVPAMSMKIQPKWVLNPCIWWIIELLTKMLTMPNDATEKTKRGKPLLLKIHPAPSSTRELDLHSSFQRLPYIQSAAHFKIASPFARKIWGIWI